MNTRFLSAAEVIQVRSIMATYKVIEFGASVRLWGRGKAIEVSGTLDQQELSCLLAISRYLSDEPLREAAPEPASAQRPVALLAAVSPEADRIGTSLERAAA